MLKGKAAVVTGSTSGIGLGIARALGRAGCDVMMNGLGEAGEIEELRGGLADETGARVEFSGADMTDASAITGMIEAAKDAFGRLDILVNNAGIQHVAPIDEFPADKWDAILAVNLTAAFHASKAALPLMRAKGWGRIINIASTHGLVASPFKSAYVAAKHGLVGLTKVIALECAEDGITCNAICPGYVLTPLVEKQIGEQAAAHGIPRQNVIEDIILAAQPTKAFIGIDHIAELAVFLCGDAASGLTGAALPIDGGWTAH
jgi:3-hydroxybutyrate dehydrogenase